MPAPAVDSLASSTLTATTASAESITTSWKAGQPVSHQQGPPVQAAAGKLTQTPRIRGTFDYLNRNGRDIPIAFPNSASLPISSMVSSMNTASTTTHVSGSGTIVSSSQIAPIVLPITKVCPTTTSTAATLTRVQSRPPSIIITEKETVLPKFHFPLGNPSVSSSGDLTKFENEFKKRKNSSVSGKELGQILTICGYPFYWKGVLFLAAGGDKTGLLSFVAFSDFWQKMCETHYDEAAQLMHILTFKNQQRTLAPEDFVPLIQDVVDTHPGLGFLKEATEFHSRYVHTVSYLT